MGVSFPVLFPLRKKCQLPSFSPPAHRGRNVGGKLHEALFRDVIRITSAAPFQFKKVSRKKLVILCLSSHVFRASCVLFHWFSPHSAPILKVVKMISDLRKRGLIMMKLSQKRAGHMLGFAGVGLFAFQMHNASQSGRMFSLSLYSLLEGFLRLDGRFRGHATGLPSLQHERDDPRDALLSEAPLLGSTRP